MPYLNFGFIDERSFIRFKNIHNKYCNKIGKSISMKDFIAILFDNFDKITNETKKKVN